MRWSALAATGAAPHDVDVARQLQTLSFVMHIPLVCFGVAFPSLVVFAEWRWLRTGDELYRTLARRWSRVMVALFAVGVVTGTILSFKMGLLWPVFTGTFGGVFGLGFAVEGFSFFAEAIFIGIYVYGWNRLPPRAHLAAGVPIVLARLSGSLMVIAVNAWMQHPAGFTLRDGWVVDAQPARALFANPYLWHELTHMYLAGYMVAGFLVAGAYAVGRGRGRRGRYERTALAIPLTAAAAAAVLQLVAGDWAARSVAHLQSVKLAAMEGVGRTVRGAPLHLLGWYNDGNVHGGLAFPRLLSLLAFHDPDATVLVLDTMPPDARPPRRARPAQRPAIARASTRRADPRHHQWGVQRGRLGATARARVRAVRPGPPSGGRPSLEQNYFEVFNQGNVELVDVKSAPIERVTDRGVRTSDNREYELDVLILATGFDTVTGSMSQIDIRCTDGELLRDKWSRDGVDAFLGTFINGLPNMAMINGPLSPCAWLNGPSAAEFQGREIVWLLQYLRDNGRNRFESTAESDKAWRAHADELANATLLPRATGGWYMGDNVPGKPRQLLSYCGGFPRFLQNWRETRTSGYDGLQID